MFSNISISKDYHKKFFFQVSGFMLGFYVW